MRYKLCPNLQAQIPNMKKIPNTSKFCLRYVLARQKYKIIQAPK